MEDNTSEVSALTYNHIFNYNTDKKISFKYKPLTKLLYESNETDSSSSNFEFNQKFPTNISQFSLKSSSPTSPTKLNNYSRVVYETQVTKGAFNKDLYFISEDVRNEIEKGPKSDSLKYYEYINEPNPEYISKKLPKRKDPNCLKFDSIFESGNLQKAIRIAEYEYILLLKADTRANNYTHWFYFSCKNKNPATVKFHIINFKKFDKLCAAGMQPVILSNKALQIKSKA